MNILNNINLFIGYFVMGYPIAMAVVWIISGLLFWLSNERKKKIDLHDIDEWPAVTILIPCHNEAEIISRTCEQLMKIDYPSLQVVFVDDASSDDTAEVIRAWTDKQPSFHLLRLAENQGKSNALNSALAVAVNTPVTVIMDADTLPHPTSIKIFVKSLLEEQNIGAVTGQPIVYNRENILEKIQAVEFTSIIGLIKRAQNLYGHLFSISGCITAFKTEALHKVRGFSSKTATEDIDITWALQKAAYRVRYDPRAIAYIQVPNKFTEFWKQRKRWALGGWHLLRTHKDVLVKWKYRRLSIVYVDISLSYLWSLLFVFGIFIWIPAGLIMEETKLGVSPLPAFTSIMIIICLIQFVVSIKLSRPYDRNIWKLFFLIPWYPLVYFTIGAFSVCRTSLKGCFENLQSAGKWRSPQRIKLMK